MKRRLVWVPGAVLVVVLAGGGSFWARQVIAENLAHSGYLSALHKAQHDLGRARSDGMFASELQPYQSKVSALLHRTPPADPNLWTGNRESFFNQQASTARSVDRALDRELQGLTHTARKSATTLVAELKRQIHQARREGLEAAKYVSSYGNASLNLRSSAHLGQYRALSGDLQPEVDAFAKVIRLREKDVKGLTKAILKSPRRLVAARHVIDSRRGQALHDLAILEMFHKPHDLGRWLNHVVRWARARSTVRGSVLGAADIGSVDAAIRKQMNRYVPAKWILVSTENETITWYQKGKAVGTSLCTTGNPALPTVKGHFSIIAKFSPFTFVSPDPPSSPYYYPPSPVSFAMEFQVNGYYIHDAPWRSAFGPGTDGPGQPGTNYGGTHGCVNVPYNVAAFLFGWTAMGTPVVVV